MRSFIPPAIALLASASRSRAQEQHDDADYDNPCKSFGIDFQDKGKYFQNISSSDPFTFVSTFEGCKKDFANNILVDPNGDEYLCSDTALTPDDVYQMATCPLEKNQLWTGPWSVIIISNNGDEGEPIAYMRDFSLSVGIPSTTIVRTPRFQPPSCTNANGSGHPHRHDHCYDNSHNKRHVDSGRNRLFHADEVHNFPCLYEVADRHST